MTEKLKLNGAEFDIESVRAALKEYDEAKEKESELFHGYTMAQWQRIIDGEYLCECCDIRDSNEYIISTIEEVAIGESFAFHAKSNDCWRYCRPAQRYGVLIPHFGGDKPEWLGDYDMIVYCRWKSGDVGKATPAEAKYLAWFDCIEFIAMPAEA